MDEVEDFFGNDEFDREPSPEGEEAIEVNAGPSDEKKLNDIFEKGIAKPKRIQNPRLNLNENTLTGKKGLLALRETFEGFKPNPKDDPYNNLEKMMKKYAYWGHLMYPKMKTEDLLSRCETVGTRRQVKVFMMKHRLGMPHTDEDFAEIRKKDKQLNRAIIDDGADDEEQDDGLFGEKSPEKSLEAPEMPEVENEPPPKDNPVEDYPSESMEEEEERRLREMENAEEELLADFDVNNDW